MADDGYDAADNSRKCYDLAIDTLRQRLESFRCEEIGPHRLYMGDCREILPLLPRFDACVTDPPYGIDINASSRLSVSRGFGGETWDAEPVDAATVNLIRGKAKQVIIWGGNYFDLPPTRCFLIWDKNNAGRDFADVEMAWTNIDAVARRFMFRPMNMDGGKLHPTQKPIEVMKWCLDHVDGRTILDPFMGSGTTGVACSKRGLLFTGVEREPRYFDVACRRIEEAMRQPDLFVSAPAPKAEQLNLLG